MKKGLFNNIERFHFHVLSAINGFVRAISLGGRDITKTLQNLLRLLKLWFQQGDQPDIEQIMRASFEIIDINTWLAIIPQILARIDMKNMIVKKTMYDLLDKIGYYHPQALIYP